MKQIVLTLQSFFVSQLRKCREFDPPPRKFLSASDFPFSGYSQQPWLRLFDENEKKHKISNNTHIILPSIFKSFQMPVIVHSRNSGSWIVGIKTSSSGNFRFRAWNGTRRSTGESLVMEFSRETGGEIIDFVFLNSRANANHEDTISGLEVCPDAESMKLNPVYIDNKYVLFRQPSKLCVFDFEITQQDLQHHFSSVFSWNSHSISVLGLVLLVFVFAFICIVSYFFLWVPRRNLSRRTVSMMITPKQRSRSQSPAISSSDDRSNEKLKIYTECNLDVFFNDLDSEFDSEADSIDGESKRCIQSHPVLIQRHDGAAQEESDFDIFSNISSARDVPQEMNIPDTEDGWTSLFQRIYSSRGGQDSDEKMHDIDEYYTTLHGALCISGDRVNPLEIMASEFSTICDSNGNIVDESSEFSTPICKSNGNMIVDLLELVEYLNRIGVNADPGVFSEQVPETEDVSRPSKAPEMWSQQVSTKANMLQELREYWELHRL